MIPKETKGNVGALLNRIKEIIVNKEILLKSKRHIFYEDDSN